MTNGSLTDTGSIVSYSTVSIPDDEGTTGCLSCKENCIYAPSGAQPAIKYLKDVISGVESESIRKQIISFCSCLSKRLFDGNITQQLPSFHLDVEDGEYFFEWIFDYYRFGFDFHENPLDSEWFVSIRGDADRNFRYESRFEGDYQKAIDYTFSILGGFHE